MLSTGKFIELQKMPIPKSLFAVTLRKERRSLFALGGWNESVLKEVYEYSISKSKWKSHSELQEPTYGSSAVVFSNAMYNIGGVGSSHSVV